MTQSDKLKDYCLEFSEGHQFRTEPEPFYFQAESDEAALAIIVQTLEIPLPFTATKFYRHGGSVLYEGKRQVFPVPVQARAGAA